MVNYALDSYLVIKRIFNRVFILLKEIAESATHPTPTTTSTIPNNDRQTTFIKHTDEPVEYHGINAVETNELFVKNWSDIKSYAMMRRFTKIYNVRIVDNNIAEALKQPNVLKIFKEQKFKFKLNASLGFILINNNEQKLRYYHASSNKDRLFSNPVLIESLEDYTDFVNRIMDKDFIEHVTRNRPDTSWSVHCVTNLCFYLWMIPDHVVGCPGFIPDHIKNNKSVVSLANDSNGLAYTDNLCLFRAICLPRNYKRLLESTTLELFKQYNESLELKECQFSGVSIEQLPHVERLFSLSIYVYKMNLVDGDTQAEMIYRSTTNHKTKLNLHLEGNHYCFIKNIRLYTKSYKCTYCSKLLKSSHSLKLHMASCSSMQSYSYPSGVCGVPYSKSWKAMESKLMRVVGIILTLPSGIAKLTLTHQTYQKTPKQFNGKLNLSSHP